MCCCRARLRKSAFNRFTVRTCRCTHFAPPSVLLQGTPCTPKHPAAARLFSAVRTTGEATLSPFSRRSSWAITNGSVCDKRRARLPAEWERSYFCFNVCGNQLILSLKGIVNCVPELMSQPLSHHYTSWHNAACAVCHNIHCHA